MSKPQTRPDLASLAEKPNADASHVDVPRLIHAFRVEYRNEFNEASVLTAGQVLPVWDLHTWKLINGFTAISMNALYAGDRVVAAPGFDSPLISGLYGLVRNARRDESLGDEPDADVRATLQLLENTPLGNVGGRRIVRPGLKPLGVIPVRGLRTAERLPLIETDDVSVLDWASNTIDFPILDAAPPTPKFYLEQSDGEHEGWDVTSGKPVALQEIPLPFSWLTPEELGIYIPDTEEAINQQTANVTWLNAVDNAVWDSVRKYNWKGRVWFGYDLPTADENLDAVEQTQISLDLYWAKFWEQDELYALSFVPNNPLRALAKDASQRIKDMLNGVAARKPHRSPWLAKSMVFPNT
jgi:hypothetical protein